MFPARISIIGVGATIEDANLAYSQALGQFAGFIVGRNQDLNDDLISESHSMLQDNEHGNFAIRSHVFFKALPGDYDENNEPQFQTEFSVVNL